MKKVFVFILLILLIIAVITTVYVYYIYQNSNINNNTNNNGSNNSKQVEIYTINTNVLLPYLFTDKSKKLIYDGGPVHWGSRTKVANNVTSTSDSKTVVYKVTDNSDLKGEEPPKVTDEVWKLKTDGLYIDDVLAIKLPLKVNSEWTISSYEAIAKKGEKHTAKIKITDISNTINENNEEVQRITTVLTIDDIKMNYNAKYTETTVYETGLGIKTKSVTEPTIEDLNLNYFILSKSSI
ncbi:MAG: hypothetical protein N2749_04410 [Clostridia bacterium]|nr:hypothetical protein [Clostridia bacterium]